MLKGEKNSWFRDKNPYPAIATASFLAFDVLPLVFISSNTAQVRPTAPFSSIRYHQECVCVCHIKCPVKKATDRLAWDHALSKPSPYYLFMSLTGRGHDTFLCRITCKNTRIWTFFWLDRKQRGWFALFRLAKMKPSVSCCWFQSAFLLA